LIKRGRREEEISQSIRGDGGRMVSEEGVSVYRCDRRRCVLE
jgi:hypothetical protein